MLQLIHFNAVPFCADFIFQSYVQAAKRMPKNSAAAKSSLIAYHLYIQTYIKIYILLKAFLSLFLVLSFPHVHDHELRTLPYKYSFQSSY